jgi:hypothetical protein
MRRLLVLVPILAASPAWADLDPGSDADAGPPVILRGERATPPPARPAAEPGPAVVLSGETLWLLDQRDGTLRACRLVNTTQVGVQRIRCSDGDLR